MNEYEQIIRKKDQELNKCYAIMQLQMQQIESISSKIEHLEKLLKYNVRLLKFDKE